jgi:hypothetical protein
MAARGEGIIPFIPPAELGGILAYFDKVLFSHFSDRGVQAKHA